MALANFFDKAALSAASFLRGTDVSAIRDRLLRHVIGVAFDASATGSGEARHTLALLIDLLARLYPRIAIIALPADVEGETVNAMQVSTAQLVETLRQRAITINPRIEIENCVNDATVLIAVGGTAPAAQGAREAPNVGTSGTILVPTLYVGSSGWDARLSAHGPVGSGPSDNPFAAGAAACLAAASVFRTVFAAELGISITTAGAAGPGGEPSEGTTPTWTNVSLLDLEVSGRIGPAVTSDTPMATEIDIGETFLVGAGAIGEAAAWALARAPGLVGTLHVVDGEAVELSNLQRYPLTTQESVGEQKVTIVKRAFARTAAEGGATPNTLAVATHPSMWGAYIAARGDYMLDRVLLALDSAEDRMAVQTSLPRWIANAWTQPDNLGVSRHDFLGDGPCVCCLYFPTGPRKSKDVLYAEALKCTTQAELMEVRTLLHNRKAIGQEFILRAAARMGVPAEDLLPFAHQSLDEFYVSALCAGLVLRLGGQLGVGRPAEVPMAFQSALAGILLAAELVMDAAGLRPHTLPARTEIDLVRMDFLSPRGLRIGSPMMKHPSGRCICQDATFRERYQAKYVLPLTAR